MGGSETVLEQVLDGRRKTSCWRPVFEGDEQRRTKQARPRRYIMSASRRA